MPELPEVQTTVNGLNSTIRGLGIVDAWTDYDSTFFRGKDSIKDPAYFKIFRKNVTGARVTHVERIAKNILIHTDRGVILIHMKMTGHIMVGRYVHKKGSWIPAPDERSSLSDPYNRFIHFVIALSDGRHVVLCDSRKFAKVTFIAHSDLKESLHLADIGPDPLDGSFDFKLFVDRLHIRKTGRIKNVLMVPSIIAGVGNIYSDEALWRAGINPEERVLNVPVALLKKLYSALLAVLSRGIDFGGDSMSDYRNVDGERGKFQNQHKVYQRKGERCLKPGCKGTIIRKVIGGRSGHFCDTHQRLLTK